MWCIYERDDVKTGWTPFNDYGHDWVIIELNSDVLVFPELLQATVMG